jgi:hypothetical protein
MGASFYLLWGVRRAVPFLVAGFVMSTSPAIAQDQTPPVINLSVHPNPSASGWFTVPVTANWSVFDPDSAYFIDAGCDPSKTYTADTTGQVTQCSAHSDGGSVSRSRTLRIDKTPPSATPVAERGADAGGYYNHPLSVAWTGADGTSGIASCTSLAYNGPDGTGVSVSGTCTDQAGNVSAPVAFVFNYDATAPALGQLHANAEDQSVILSWQASGATQIVVTRSVASVRAAQSGVVYSGTDASFTDTGLSNGAKYTYTVQAFDAASNVSTASITAVPSAAASSERLIAPPRRAELQRPPLLRWRPVKKASYYNVQLVRKGKKILSVWPRLAHYQLKSVWKYRGHRHRLVKGKYFWYVWGGYGRRSEHRYGKLLGKRSFKIT